MPSHPELLPEEGTPRQQLAGWVIDSRNPYLARATVNRVWAIIFGRPLVDPIDDLATVDAVPPALDILADDFAEHGYDLHRLIRTIAATEAFRLEATSRRRPTADPQDETWAAFPMTRLRPEQVAGGVNQAAAVATLGPESSWVVRFINFTQRNDFVRRYGDAGEDEFAQRGGTIPQRLLMMNGELVQEKTKDELFNASKRIAHSPPTTRRPSRLAYLAVLTRRPTPEEAAHFLPRFKRHQWRPPRRVDDRPVLDAPQRDRVLLEPLRIEHARSDRRSFPVARRPELADARRPAARPAVGAEASRAGAVGHPALARRRPQPA